MKIRFNINPLRPAAETAGLVRRLEARYGAHNVNIVNGTAVPLPRSVQILIELERLLYRLPAQAGQSPQQPANRTGSQSAAVEGEGYDIAVDLSGDLPRAGGAKPCLRVLYDGVCDDRRVYAALLASRLPLIEIADVASGRVLASGTPCVDNAETLAEAVQWVFARVETLLMAALERPQSSQPRQALETPLPGVLRLAEIQARNLASAAARRLYRLCCHAPHWRIGWRTIEGPGVLERGDLGGTPWRVLADPGNRFYADPMPITVDGRSYIFFEDFPHATQKGIISFVEIKADGTVGPVRPVLEESWHLSYPFLMQIDGAIFMVPESSGAREVTVYRADPFPHRWVRHATLLSGIDINDATILEHHGRLWMFGSTRDGAGSPSDTLSIFSSDRLEGRWVPHPGNPVLIDPVAARPAGPCVRQGGRIWRVTQDCSGGYGKAVGLVEILRLDEQSYEQRLHKVVRPDAAWPGRRFHTVARAGKLECVDGSASAPKSRLVSRLFFPDRNGEHALEHGSPSRGRDEEAGIEPSQLR